MASQVKGNWRKHWAVDLVACTVSHDNGLVVTFPNLDNDDFEINEEAVFGADLDMFLELPQLLCEAAEIIREARAVQKQDA
jgi:hypothetical protein